MKLVVVDYGMGNLGSVRRAIEECGTPCLVLGEAKGIGNADGIILPGVGSFREGMEHLHSRGLVVALKQCVKNGTPILGICLGMQLLADRGDEGGPTEGLGLIPGEIHRLVAARPEERIPHMGWNEVNVKKEDLMFEGVPSGTDFYFVHSYHFVPADDASIAAVTPYCGKFVSAVRQGQVYGTQFHPEKSAKGGFRFLNNFIKVCSARKVPC